MSSSIAENVAASLVDAPALYIHPDRCAEWLPSVPLAAAVSLFQNKRLVPRMSTMIASYYQLESVGYATEAHMAIANLRYEALIMLIHLSGAIFNAQYLRTQISSAAIADLLIGLNNRAYAAAVGHANLGRPISGEARPPITLTRQDLIDDGKLCFRAWVETLPSSISQRLWLKFPSDAARRSK